MKYPQRTELVEASLIRRYFDLAAQKRLSGERVIDMSIGQPHLPTPDQVVQVAQEALQGDMNGYLPTAGYPPLLDNLRRHLVERRGHEPQRMMITAGASGAVTLALLATAEAGDEVLLPDPYFVSYPQLCHIAGATPTYYDTYPDFNLKAEAVEAAITDRTRVIVVNSPANPTGAVHGRDELQQVAEIARRHDLVVISDEIYDTLLFEGEHQPMAPLYDRTITIGGWGKSMSVTGWRVGYAAGPEDILSRMIRMQMFTYVCVAGPVQQAISDSYDIWDDDYAAEIYRDKCARLCDGLAGHYNYVRPRGAFYLFAEAPGGDASSFCERAVEAGILVIPGSGFSRRDTHFRISFAVVDEIVQEATALLQDLARG